MTDRDTARAAKAELRAELARLPEVTGIGIGRRQGSYVITVNVTEQAACEHVPDHVHGVVVEVRVTGQVRTLRGADATPSAPVGSTDADAAEQASRVAGPGCDEESPA